MHELNCPNCNASATYETSDYMHMCPVCSSSFLVHYKEGTKEIFNDHFIVPNQSESGKVQSSVTEWLRRLHHKPAQTKKEFIVSDITGYSIPFWVVSVEVHTRWKGFVKRQTRNFMDPTPGGNFLTEEGVFSRTYRWCVSARGNLFEHWGLAQLHVPNEELDVEWDGFPLDSTFTRGILDADALTRKIGDEVISAHVYEEKEPFEFKFANGIRVLGVQTPEEEAIRRAKRHIDLYHEKLSRLNVDTLVDVRTEFDFAGIQLVHLPFWFGKYVYRPANMLSHFQQPKERNIIVEGFTNGILNGEFVMTQSDKLVINTYVTALAAVVLFILGVLWHSSFFLIALFAGGVSVASAQVSSVRKKAQNIKNLQQKDSVEMGASQEQGTA
ncbi:hypothetical protein N9W79_02455 [bacterium]|nr:hypothetical protein [bacterium]